MKIGILTASKTNNNGTDIQAYAMQRLITSLGYDAEIIDYGCKKLNSARHFLRIRSIKDLVRLPWNVYMQAVHEEFRKTYFRRSRYMDPQDLNLSEYDAVIVGSDQIWNLGVTGYDLNFFLPSYLGVFKRMSYAASIGRADISGWDKEYHIASLLQQFSVVSVRERSAVDSLKAIGIEAREDLDSIIAAGKGELSKLIPKQPIRLRFVLLYLVEENTRAVDDAVRYAKEHNCKVYMITCISKPTPGEKAKWFVSLQKWLSLMNAAEVVFTNSYHGVSTAITLNTDFRAYPLNSVDGNLRVMSLLEKIGLMPFYIESPDGKVDSSPDWVAVNGQIDLYARIGGLYE